MGVVKKSADKKCCHGFLANISPKMGFLFGVIAGIAIFSTVSFFLLYGIFLKTARIQDTGYVPEEAEKVQEEPEAAVPEAQAPGADLSKLEPISDNEHIAGSEKGKLEMVVFTDFQCPFCSRHAETVGKIVEEYGDDVKLVLRHFPLGFHPEAKPAAMAAECAGDQGKFWEMHDELFAMSAEGTLGAEGYDRAAKELELDAGKFAKCIDDAGHAEKIQSDYQQGIAVGVKGTPATFVNGKLISGAVPYDSFKSIIESELGN